MSLFFWHNGARMTPSKIVTIGLCLAWVNVSGTPLSVERDAVPFLKNGTEFFGVSGGGVYGSRALSNQEVHEMGVVHFSYGQVTSDEWSPGKWYGGNWSISGELTLGNHYRENRAALAGVAIIGRYVFGGEGSWHPFLLGGIGANWTDIGEPDLGGKFQFSPQAGVGTYWFINTGMAVTFEYRFIHYSNGGLRTPNGGINANAFLVGFSVFR